MAGPVKKCYDDGHCFYVYTDAWHVWGRWVLLGVLIAFLILMIPISGYLMSLKRMRQGLGPVSGCGWMFSNPYKNAQMSSQDEESMTSRPPRYRPYDPYRQHQREIMQQNERMRMEQVRMNNGYSSTEFDTGETDHSYEEKSQR